MKFYKLHILFAVMLVGVQVSTAQSLKELYRAKGKNYFELSTELRNNPDVLKEASDKDRKRYERWKWFWDTRVDSTGSLEKFNTAMNSFFADQYPDGTVYSSSLLKSASSLVWSCLGPSSRPSGSTSTIGRGRVLCIWVDPSNFNHILIGTNNGGLMESNNGGVNWVALTNTMMTGGVFDIAVDPSNSNNIYIVTGSRLQPYASVGMTGSYSLGIFKTTNGGNSWTQMSIATDPGEYFEGVLMHPSNNSILYALSNKNVYKSINSGTSWSKLSLSITDDVSFRDILFKPNDPNTIYISGENGLYCTTDGGATWSDRSSNLTSLYTDSRIAISTNPANHNELYAYYIDLNQSGKDRIDKSTDGGLTWSNISQKALWGRHYALVIKLSPNGDIYAGGIWFHKSTDGGQTFPQLYSGYVHPDIMDVEFPDPNDNNLVYIVNDGGVYMDNSGGSSWDRINGDLATNEFYDIGILQGNSDIMVGGTHDCGSYIRDDNGNWSYAKGGDGGTSLYDQSGNGIYYVTANRSLYRSNKSTSPIAALQFYDAPLCMDPDNSDVLFAQTWDSSSSPSAHLKKSTNRGDSWITIDKTWNLARDITICEEESNYMYYSMWCTWEDSRIRRSADGGNTWEDVDHSDIASIRAVAPITDVHVHPLCPQKIWATFGGFESTKKIYYSQDRGDNWTNVTGSGLPNLPIQCFEYDFLNQRMFVGTDVGVYYKDMEASSWNYATGFPRTVVSKIKLNRLTGDLIVSTFGRGIWSTKLEGGYCYDSTPMNINSSTTWSTNNKICSDLNINSGNLKITADILFSYKSTITVKSGATLEVDGGKITNGRVIVESGGNLVIKNNGILEVMDFEIKEGGESDFSYGEIVIVLRN